MKKLNIFCVLLFLFITIFPVQAQKRNYINISVTPGLVTKSEFKEKTSIGGSISWLVQDNWITKCDCPNYYLSFTLKGMNNPYGSGAFITNILNNKDDGFTYLGGLVGYRFTQKGIVSGGFFAEPRIGIGYGYKLPMFLISPIVGYSVKMFDIGAFCDAGFSGKENAIGSKNFLLLGLSLGVNLGW